ALPEHAFATRNFHSGDYADGDELNAILHFRRKSLKDYYDAARDRISPLSRFLVGLVPKFMIRRYLIRMSAPLKAIKENDTKLIERFYGSRRAFENMSKCCDRTAYAV
ncbi:MAG: hypothetical protein U9Q82_01445, partial [Chloroflexota bacterium]|nr:hypothetical protein [Chloroflexota bacterium]